jgi:hypothetical protein
MVLALVSERSAGQTAQRVEDYTDSARMWQAAPAEPLAPNLAVPLSQLDGNTSRRAAAACGFFRDTPSPESLHRCEL